MKMDNIELTEDEEQLAINMGLEDYLWEDGDDH